MAGSLFLDGYKRPKKDKKKDEKKTEVKKPQSSSASRVNERANNSTFMGGGASVQKVKQNSTAPTKPRSANNQQTSTTTQQRQTGTGRQTTTTRHTPTSREMISQRQTDTGTGRRTTSNRRTPTAKEMMAQRKAEENERRRNRDANLNLKQTQAAESRRRAKPILDTVDNAARNLGDKANKWEKENLSARNPMLETQRTVKNQKAAESASERQQKKFEKLDKADQEAIKAKMQESSLGRTVGNATDRWIEREKGILHSSASTLADFGDMLNDEKSNKSGRIAEDYAGLLPDAKETKRQMRQAYADYADKADKSAARLSKLTDKAASNVIEKKFYEAEDVAQGMISDKALSILTGGNWAIPLFMRTYSQAKREAEKNGATEAEARVSGLMNSAIEIGTEGAGGYFGKGDKLLGKLGSKLENRIVNKFEGETAKKVASFIARWERNNIEESLEEVIGNPLQNLSENLVYRNRVQNERVAQESDSLGELGASIQRAFAENPTEVERYIAELNSPDTRDSFVKDFMEENGLDKKQAETAADKMLAFMQAAATNDVKQMEEIRASLSQDLAGDTKKKVFDWRENLNAVLISHLVGVGSGVNAASTMAQGQAILNAPNSKGAMQNALQKTAAFSSENSAKAKGLLETMEKDDYTPTATQAYDIMANENTVMAESAERQRAAEQVKEKAIKRENLSVPVSTVRADGKHIITGEQTTERYLNRAVDTFELVEAINGSIHNESEKVSDDVAQKMADIVPSFDVGTLDVSHTAELTTDHTEERYIFKEMTGVDLNQFNVYDKNGNLDAVASNINMQKGLLAMSAQNYIESARIEQLAWNDQARGQIADVLGSKFNPQGDIAIHDALESVDPRDQSKFMLMTRVAQDVYRNAYTTTDSWQEVKKTYQKLYPSLNIDALEGMYESAKADRAEDETPYLNYEVKAGEALDSISNGEAKPQIRGKFVNETPYNAETGEGRILAESDRIVLASMAKGINANITMIDAEDDRLAYTDEYGETQYNNASVDLATGEILLSNACDIGTAIHEVTHVGARLASRYYRDLADYIFDMAYKHDPEKTMRILDAYRRSYADQNLSDAKLKEEAVSDLVAAFQNDPRFARDMAQGDPSIIRKIINAIEDLLRSLRNILATGKIQDPAVQNSFLVEIGAYEDARKMWLRMYREAQKNSAALGIAKWHEDQIRDNRVANARHTNVEQAEKERELFFRDSNGNGLTERQAQIVHDIGPDIKFSRPTFLNDLAKGEYYAGLNNGTGGFAGLREIASGKDILIRTMRNNGFGEDQTNAVVGFLTHMADYLDGDDLHMKYSFIGWQDLSDAEITVRRDKDDKIVGVAVSAMVANGEYPVNFDMTTICNKREGVMEVIQELTRKYDADTGRTILNSIKLTDEKMWSINEALKAEGIDTACLGCFVEARRYYTNRFIDKVDDVWNNAVRDARRQLGLPEEEYFNFAKGKKVSGEDYNRISDLWTAYDESTEAKRSPAQRIKILMDEIVRNKEVDSPYLKLISAEDILTPEGIDGFKRISTKDRDMVKMIKSIYGTSAPKEILAFTPYNSEIALLPDKIKGKDAGAYLRSIGGTRVQSFSDFKMAHMFDHMQMVADEAARKFVNHGYSKVIAYPRLFGLTGRKINMSVMFDVLPASEWQSVLGCSEEAAKEIAKKYQGLRFVKELPEWYGVEGHEKNDNRPYIETEIEGVQGYLTYLVSDADYVNSVFDELYQQYLAEGMDEDTARREANKAKPFEQSINYREAVALENQEGYKENVGIIAVAYGDEHLKILLDDPNVRYIIPYHRSGLPVFIAQKTALDIARDYTDSQNTRKAKRGMWFDKDGTKFNLKARYKNFKAEYEQTEHPEGSFPAIEFFKEISQLTFDNPVLTEDEINEKIDEYIKTLPEDISEEQKNELVKKQRKKLKKKDTSLAGTGSFDVYKDLDKVSDIREISNAYLEHCINKNQVPIFYDFASHPNYYKMLFDFAVTDAEGNIYPQRPVRNVYPGLDIDAKVAAGEEITEEDYAEFYKAIEEGLQTENAKNKLRSNRLSKVLDEDLLSREGENSIIADSNIQHIVNGTPDYTNPKSSDIANSRDVDLDETYMQAVNSGDMETAQRLVDEAAKRVGYKTPRLYHGTPNFGFTVFDGTGFRDHDGWFFSDRKDAAESYAYGDEAGTYSVYLNLENPLVIDADGQDWTDIQTYTSLEARDRAKEIDARLDEIRDAWQNGTDNGEYDRLLDELDELESEASSGDTDSWVALAKENGHDGLIIKNIIDYGASYEGEEYEPFTEYIAFNQEQIKSADPVTYAEDGSVIPLSERFDPNNNDIRYSRPTVDADGNILTDGQVEYFKNSQARDSQGRLVPVYHTTNHGGFTIFDPWYSQDHRSLFFASNFDVSQTYGYRANQPIDLNAEGRKFNTFEEAEEALGGSFKGLVSRFNVEIWRGDVDNPNTAWELGDNQYLRVAKYIDIAEGHSTDEMLDGIQYIVHTNEGDFESYSDFLNFLSNQVPNYQKGYYQVYLNLQNPLVVDANGANWSAISYNGKYQTAVDIARTQIKEDTKLGISDVNIDFDYDEDEGWPIAINLEVRAQIKTANGEWKDWIINDSYSGDITNDPIALSEQLESWAMGVIEGMGVNDEFLDSIFMNHQNVMSGGYNFHTDNITGYEWFTDEGDWIGEEGYLDEETIEASQHIAPTYNTRQLAELAQNEGYDGVIIQNLRDLGGQLKRGANPYSDIFIAFSSNQVKDINNENPTSDPDIRYSRTVDDEAMSHMAHDYAYDNSYEALAHYEEMIAADEPDETVYQKAKNYIAKDVDRFYSGLTRYADGMRFDDPVLEEGRTRMARSKQDFFNSNKAKWNQNWLTDGEVLDIKSVEKAVRDLVTGTMLNSNTNRKYNQETVKKTLMDMRLAYFYAKQGRTDIADALLWHSAHRMIDGVEFYREDGNFETYKRLRDYFKDAKLQLGEDYWNDVDYAAFRKMNFGRLNLVRGKTNLDKILDDLYHENSDGSIEGIAVEWFNPEAFEKNNYKIDSVPDILLQIADVLDTVEPYAEAYSSEYCAEWATDIASDLLDIMQSGKELQSTADKYKNRYDAKAKAMKARHAEAMLKVRQQRDEGIKREKLKLKEYVERQREKKSHAKHFMGIQKSYNTLKDRLLTNTADKNIPEQYKKDLARLLAAFDLQTVGSKKYEARTGRQGQNTIKMAAVRVALRNIENKTGEFHVSDAVTDIIDELMGEDVGNGSNRSIEGLTIDELSVSELARIDKLLKALVHEFNTYRYVKVKAKRMQVEDIGKAQVEDALNHADKFGRRKDYQNMIGVLDRIINMGEMTPAYMFRLIDPNNVGLGMMWKEIRRSFDRYVRNQNQLNDWMQEIVGKYHQKGILWNKYGSGELSNWRSINYQQTFQLENGHSVTLTPAQMMSLYCLSKRNQAYNHMTGAGIIVAPVSFQAKVRSDIKKKADMSLPEKLTDADIDKITAQLTDDQKHVADELQKLMSEKMAAWGNEASMNVLGIELFGEPDYFPIKSDKAALEKDLNADEFAQAIRNFGFTKAVQPGARNAIMIDDIFDVVAEHCNNMNLYNSYSETMNDFMKVYNYRDFRDDGREYTVQQAVAHAYSQKATTFIMTFMRDLNGNVSGRSSAIEDAYNYTLGNAKKAAVFANFRVAAQQPTALVRAFAEINPKYLKGIKVGQGDMKEMFEHCPIALWKSWGYYDINMGKSIEDLMMNNGRWLEDKATDLYGALDNVTWTAIWQMVKAETRDKHPELKEGTDEFFEHCNERMSEIVDLTQVVDSPMHRSHEMRSKNVISKLATAFMAEPTLTFNMVKSGYRRSIEAWKSGDKKKAIGIAQRTFNVFMIQAGTVAVAAAMIDALRHKKPDKDDEDDRFLHLWWVNTIENFHDNIKLWNNIYYVKDIVSMFEGWDNTNLGLQGWKSLATGWNQLTGNGYVRSSKEWYENMAYGLGYIFGIPVKTMMTGISNALNMFGLTIPGIEAVTGMLDTTQEAFQGAFQKDDAEVKTGSMAASLIGVVLSDDKSLMDSVAEKMGYKRIEASASTDNSSSSTSESEGTSYSVTEDDLPDNLTDEQKKDILKAGEKRAKKAEPEETQEQLNYDKMLYDAMKAAAGLEGEEYNKKVYSSVAQGLKGYVADGDYTSIGMMRTVIEQAGGDVAYFDQRVMEETKSAYKKTLVYSGDMYSPEGLEARNNQKAMFRYMMNHGMTQEELSSEVLYKSELAKDMKVAYRVGDNDLIVEAMTPLVDAGITKTDLERLYENRNRMDLTKYKQNGRFKDKLKSMGTFIWPTEGVITSHFGYRNAPTAGASSNHPAIDIGAPTGTPVVAADGGVVISAGANGGYGNSVGIKHDNGMITWYNHLSGWNVKVGDTVGQGQQIAQVGSTGISTGPHLDFKILDADGNPVDPEKYLNKR